MINHPFPWEKRPQHIIAQSFQKIQSDYPLDHQAPTTRAIIWRMIHTCGDASIAENVDLHSSFYDACLGALNANAPIYCDVTMLQRGLNPNWIKSPTHCWINDDLVIDYAKQNKVSRAIAAVDLYWTKPVHQAPIWVIGNAPTALFQALTKLQQKLIPKPVCVIGMPVGFVGAAESKAWLAMLSQQMQLPAIWIVGTRGGSALAASVINAISKSRMDDPD